MASAYSPRWLQLLHKYAPFLFKQCRGGGNYHWRWDRLCFCWLGSNGNGIWDFKLKREYQPQEEYSRLLDEHVALLRRVNPSVPPARGDWTDFHKEKL